MRTSLISFLVGLLALVSMPAHAANHSFETATPLTLGVPVTDDLYDYAPDYFQVTVPQDGKLTLTFQHQNLDDGYYYWNVELFDAAGTTQIMAFPVAGNRTDTVYQVGLPAGSYFVRVTLANSADVPYTLSAGFTPGNYEKELNDTQESANPVNFDTSYEGGYQPRGLTDQDRYRFQLPSDGIVSVSFTQNIQAPYYWRVSLVDATGTVVYFRSDITGDPAESVRHIGLPAGSYWLSVTPYYSYGWDDFSTFASSPYTLNLGFTPGTNFEKEQNDTVGSATEAYLNESYFGFIQDKNVSDWDYYRFRVEAPGTLPLEFIGPAQSVHVYDSTGSQTVFYKFTASDTLQVPFRSAGEYLLMVSGTPGYDYSFRIGYPDDSAPQVISTTPAANGAGFLRNGSLLVEFSETLDPASVAANAVTLNKGVTGSVSVEGNTITFTPSAGLSQATVYTATVSGAIRDLAGNPLGGNHSWSFSTAAEDGASKTPRTGQASCSAAGGAAIACAGTGQDGDSQAGVPWPTPRFTVNGNETVTDFLTGLIWTRNANLMASRNPSFDNDWSAGDGVVSWDDALAYIKKLNSENYLGFSDWRLPNLNEMESLLNLAQQDSRAWLGASGFQNVRTFYWTSSPKRATLDETVNMGWIWLVDLGAGRNFTLGSDPSPVAPAVWPVRGGAAGAVKLPASGVVSCSNEDGDEISCTGTGQDGELRKGELAVERFLVNADRVTDLLTGLVWVKDANLIKHRDPSFDSDGDSDGKVGWQKALDYVKKLNAEKYLGYSDWRLPNVRELSTLIDFGVYDNAARLPMTGFPTSAYYWSATSFGTQAKVLGFWEGQVINETKSDTDFVLPVRGGASGAVTSTPASHNFGTVTAGATAAVQTLVISNNTGGALALGSITVTGSDAAMFAVAPGGISPCGASLAPGAVCTIEVTFSPTAGGARSAAVEVHKTGSATAVASIPLTGSGIKTSAVLSATIAGSGGGSINSTPSGVACSTGTCSASYPIGTSVTLFATPDGNSVFAGWTGICSGSGGCVLKMDDDRSTTGTFSYVSPLRILDTTARYFATIPLAYAYIADGGSATLQARKVQLTGPVLMDRNVTVRVKGGYDTSYAANSGVTAVKGSVKVRKGKLIVEKVVVR